MALRHIGGWNWWHSLVSGGIVDQRRCLSQDEAQGSASAEVKVPWTPWRGVVEEKRRDRRKYYGIPRRRGSCDAGLRPIIDRGFALADANMFEHGELLF